MTNVAVFFGGKSCENEISVLTGVFVLNLLDVERFFPVPVYIHTDGKFYTSEKMRDLNVFKKKDYSSFMRVLFEDGSMYAFNPKKEKIKRKYKIGVALNCCHGGFGEGGGVSALAELNHIPFASPKTAPSGVFMDKALTKLVAKSLSVPTVDYVRLQENDYKKRGAFLLKNIGARLKYPVVVKPAKLGSSIGISLAETTEEAKTAIEAAFALDDVVLVEKYLAHKRDINCAAYSLSGEIFVSEPEEAYGGGIYAFSDKYLNRKDGVRGNAPLDEELRKKIRAYTRTLYKRMNLNGIVRMDFLEEDGEVYLGEVNTVPGSLAYYLFCERISDAKNLFSDLLDDALKNVSAEKKVFSTGILSSVNASGKRGAGVRL